VPGQLLAWRAAELRGIDVDHPGELSKVTLTR
jgi:glutamine---fructose-6-phosphate transaminase (isomerizing)